MADAMDILKLLQESANTNSEDYIKLKKELDKTLQSLTKEYQDEAELLKISPSRLQKFELKTMTRAINLEHISNPFWHEKVVNSRFTCKDHSKQPILYFADDRSTATQEKRPYDNLDYSWLFLQTEVKLSRVIDLTTETSCKDHGIDRESIAENWELINIMGIAALPQLVGNLISLSDHIVEGIRYESAKVPGTYNLAVFPRRMLYTSYIKLNLTQSEEKAVGKAVKVKEISGKLPVPG